MKKITLGMVGAGRATELHIEALKKVHGVEVYLKTIVAKREEQLVPAAKKYGFEKYSYNIEDILEDPEIDVVDICTPPYAHAEMIEKAILSKKHVICEKPLSGYFGEIQDASPIGNKISKELMYEKMLESINQLKEKINISGKQFMYAENFIYAPAIIKAAEIIRNKKVKYCI